MKKFILIIIIALNIAACGREGSLYLEKEPAAQTNKDKS